MSELARTVLAATSQITDAQRGLASIKAANRVRKDRAYAGIGESLSEMGKTFKEYGNWQEAKRAEDDMKAILDAEALGQGDPVKSLTAIQAVKARTLKGAMLHSNRKAALTELVAKKSKSEWDRGMEYLKYKSEVDAKASLKALHDSQIRENDAQAEKARRGEAPKEIAPEDKVVPASYVRRAFASMGIEDLSDVPLDGWTINSLAKAGVKFEAPKPTEAKAPTGLAAPAPDWVREEVSQRIGRQIPAGASYRDLGLVDEAAIDKLLKELVLQRSQREAQDYVPKRVSEARKAVEKAQADYEDAQKPPTGMDFNEDERAAWREGLRQKAEAAARKLAAIEKAYKDLDEGGDEDPIEAELRRRGEGGK